MEEQNIFNLNNQIYSTNNEILFNIAKELEDVINVLKNNKKIDNIINQIKNIIDIVNNAIINNNKMIEIIRQDIKRYHYDMNKKIEKILSNVNNLNNNVNNMNLNNNLNKNLPINEHININNNNMNMNNNMNNNINMNNNMNINMNINYIMNLINNFQNNLFYNNMTVNYKYQYTQFINDLVRKNFGFIYNEKKDSYFPLVLLKKNNSFLYGNSILQCLFHIPELNSFFINSYSNSLNNFSNPNETLSKEYFNLIEKIFSGDSDIFFKTLIKYNNRELKEPKDLLLFLIKKMHEELNYLGYKNINNENMNFNDRIENESFKHFYYKYAQLNFSIFSYLFYGIIKKITTCCMCQARYYDFNYFQILNFSLKTYYNKSFNIYQGFKDYFRPLNVQNKYFCKVCRSIEDSKIVTQITNSPLFLIINLDLGENKNYYPTKINFGEKIDLIGFVDSQCNFCSYELISVLSSKKNTINNNINYFTYCKNKNNQWYIFKESTLEICNFEITKTNFPNILIYKLCNLN